MLLGDLSYNLHILYMEPVFWNKMTEPSHIGTIHVMQLTIINVNLSMFSLMNIAATEKAFLLEHSVFKICAVL